MSLFGIFDLYPGGFLNEYAKINIHSFFMLHPNETELTHSYKYILQTINWLPTFLRGSLIFRIGDFLGGL